MDGRETRFKVARVGGRRILYHLGSADEHDVEDFLEAATIHANVSALGAGGPITRLGQGLDDWGTDVLPHLAEHVELIACAAFDAEGLVFWKRDN